MSRPPHLRRGAPLRNRGQKERAVGGAERSPHILSAPPFSLTFSCAGNCSHRTPQLHAFCMTSARGSCRRSVRSLLAVYAQLRPWHSLQSLHADRLLAGETGPICAVFHAPKRALHAVSYTHLRAHE